MQGHLHGSGAAQAVLGSDSKRAVSSGARDQSLLLWDMENGTVLRQVKFAHEGEASTFDRAVFVSSWGNLDYAISCSPMEKAVKLWDMGTGTCIAQTMLDSEPTSIQCHPSGDFAVVGMANGTVLPLEIAFPGKG